MKLSPVQSHLTIADFPSGKAISLLFSNMPFAILLSNDLHQNLHMRRNYNAGLYGGQAATEITPVEVYSFTHDILNT